MVGFDLPPHVVQLRGLAREVASEQVRPAEVALDKVADPVAAYRCETYAGIMSTLFRLGFHKLCLPEQYGGIGLSPLHYAAVLEELAVGGAGLASALLVAPIPVLTITTLGLTDKDPRFKEYLERFVEQTDGRSTGAWAITEPAIGSDIFTFGRPDVHLTTMATVIDAPLIHEEGSRVAAVHRHNGFHINGTKSAFVSNGYLADAFLLMAAVDSHQGMEGTGVFIVFDDDTSVKRGRPLDKLGLRALNQAELYFDDVWVPDEMLIVPPGPAYELLLKMIVATGNTHVGILALGVARAAYEEGLAHAKERTQGGAPIFEHQAIKLKLFDAFRSIEASRAFLWKAAWLLSEGIVDFRTAVAARSVACDTAMRVTSDMIQIFGGYGISKESPVEKFYRDAKLLSIMDGTIERVSLEAASTL